MSALLVRNVGPVFRLKYFQRNTFLNYCDKPRKAVNSVELTNLNANKPLYTKILYNLNTFIEELSHLRDVRQSQAKVMELKDRLIESGEDKRQILFKLSLIRKELKRIHSDLSVIGRGNERYITLITEEVNLLQKEQQAQTEYDSADASERNLFNQLTAAINDSYEKEKIHSNTLRLWGLIGTVITSAVTLILTSIGHYYHTRQLGLVGSKFAGNEGLSNELKNVQKELQDFKKILLQNQLQPNIKPIMQQTESWGAYISRHSVNVYRWFVPKRT